jgi:hypothetical protein
LKARAKTTGCQESDGACVGGENGGTCATGHWFDVDVIAVIIVEDEQVCVACSRRTEETACLVGEDLAGDGLAGGV